MLRPTSKIVILLILCLCCAATAAQALTLKNIRFGVHPDKTRMVIELDQKAAFRAFMLPAQADKPYRLVVDLPDFSWQAGNIPRQRGTNVLDVRSDTLQPGIKRLVVDLSKPAALKTAFELPRSGGKPDRLVIDFQSVSTARFENTKKTVLGSLKVEESNNADNGVIASLSDLIAQQIEPAPPVQTTSNIKNAATGHGTTNVQIINGVPVPPRKPDVRNSAYSGGTIAPPRPKTPLRQPLIVIDAGHGGADPGAPGANRTHEKYVTLAAAKELKRQLEATGRYRAELTRSTDTYLKLYKRVSIAHEKNADLFISLHADSIGKSNVRGASIYTLSDRASDAQTAKLAARENQVDLIAGVDLSHEDKDVANILIDLAMRDTMNQSKFFANTVVTHMRANNIRVLEKPHRYAGFAVLKAADIPSVLVEMGFMSNKSEAQLLSTPNYQRKVAATLTQSIDSYFAKVQKNNEQ